MESLLSAEKHMEITHKTKTKLENNHNHAATVCS